jgi:hypothetical protein
VRGWCGTTGAKGAANRALLVLLLAVACLRLAVAGTCLLLLWSAEGCGAVRCTATALARGWPA